MNDKEMIRNIATNLKALRAKKGLTQIQLIQAIGEEKISLRSYKTYENENSSRVPLLEKIAVIADYYKCSLDFIVFNKKSIYSDSFSLEDCFKRLSELICSMVLIPQKETDVNSDYYGKYYFLAYDKEVTYYIDKLFLISKQKNDKYEYYGIYDLKMLDYYNQVIDDFRDLNISFEPSEKRLKKVLLESGLNPDEFLKNNEERIQKKRKIGALEKVKEE